MNNKVRFLLVYTLVVLIVNMAFPDSIRSNFNQIGLFGYLVIGMVYSFLFIRKTKA